MGHVSGGEEKKTCRISTSFGCSLVNTVILFREVLFYYVAITGGVCPTVCFCTLAFCLSGAAIPSSACEVRKTVSGDINQILEMVSDACNR